MPENTCNLKDGNEHFDAVVVGSGFGGAVMVYRLAKAGRKVCLLERGKKYPPGNFPRTPYEMKDNFWDPSKGLYGMFNFWAFDGVEVLVSSGLGGGSLIHSSVLMRKEDGYQDWPIKYSDLEPHYRNVELMLEPERYPYNNTPKTNALERAARDLCLTCFRPNLAVTFGECPGEPFLSHNMHNRQRYTCSLCGECTLGCNHGSKNTLDLNYLTKVYNHYWDRAQIRELCEVKTFKPRDVSGYEVHYVKRDPEGEVKKKEMTITTERLILAAGSLGTTFLLLKNREHFPEISSMLGTRFSTNGDLVTFAVKSRAHILDPSKGPVITTAIRARGKHGFYYIEDGGYPNFVNWMLELGNVPGVICRFARFILHILKRWWSRDPKSNWSAEIASLLGKSELSSRSLPLLGMGLDSPEGIMKLNKKYLDIEWPNRRSGEYFDRIRETMRRITEQLQAKFKENPIRYLKKQVITVHPLGGCPMGNSKEDGVVDSYGEVFGYPGLYIADGSVMPGPVGANPALTIAALADRFADKIVDLRLMRKLSSSNEFCPEKIREDKKIQPVWIEIEHQELGSASEIGNVKLCSVEIPFEDIVPMADYYKSFEDLKMDAIDERGRMKIKYLQWKFENEKTKAYTKSKATSQSEKPSITHEEKEEINKRYYQVTASNFSHFAENDGAKNEYLKYHNQALNKAYKAGLRGEKTLYQEALAIEAFGLHFFTDAFAAGHIRTPRKEIRDWYDRNHPNSFDKFLEFLGDYMSNELFNQHYYILRLLNCTPDDLKKRFVMPRIAKETESYQNFFSLGDIISLAIHDVEGHGLKVVSNCGSDGNSVPNGFHWETIGDGFLLGCNPDAKIYIKNAVNASVKELEKAYSLGLNCNNKDSDSNCEFRNSNGFNTATDFIPKPDPSLKPFSEVYKWQWGTLNENTKKAVKASIKYNEEIFDQVKGIANNLPNWGFINSKKPFKRFFECFRKNPVEILEKVFGESSPGSKRRDNMPGIRFKNDEIECNFTYIYNDDISLIIDIIRHYRRIVFRGFAAIRDGSPRGFFPLDFSKLNPSDQFPFPREDAPPFSCRSNTNNNHIEMDFIKNQIKGNFTVSPPISFDLSFSIDDQYFSSAEYARLLRYLSKLIRLTRILPLLHEDFPSVTFSGNINIDGKPYPLNQAKGAIAHHWGWLFPNYIYLMCNDFEDSTTTLTLSFVVPTTRFGLDLTSGWLYLCHNGKKTRLVSPLQGSIIYFKEGHKLSIIARFKRNEFIRVNIDTSKGIHFRHIFNTDCVTVLNTECEVEGVGKSNRAVLDVKGFDVT